MAQISLYIDDSMAERLGAAAKARNYSLSRYVASLLNERIIEEDAEEIRKKQILEELQGSLRDASFTEPPEIPFEAEIRRRFDLI